MSREIKFRAKRIDNGEWEYGYYAKWQNEDVFFPLNPMGRMRKVIPETVGQFTGLLDKNGKEIYEGDLISESGSKPYEVKWQFHSVQWIMQDFSEGRYYREMAFDYAQISYEIIGNIYENPELLNS